MNEADRWDVAVGQWLENQVGFQAIHNREIDPIRIQEISDRPGCADGVVAVERAGDDCACINEGLGQ
ncbi:hypothetical protein D3C85_1896290 [compost metagenome]